MRVTRVRKARKLNDARSCMSRVYRDCMVSSRSVGRAVEFDDFGEIFLEGLDLTFEAKGILVTADSLSLVCRSFPVSVASLFFAIEETRYCSMR